MPQCVRLRGWAIGVVVGGSGLMSGRRCSVAAYGADDERLAVLLHVYCLNLGFQRTEEAFLKGGIGSV